MPTRVGKPVLCFQAVILFLLGFCLSLPEPIEFGFWLPAKRAFAVDGHERNGYLSPEGGILPQGGEAPQEQLRMAPGLGNRRLSLGVFAPCPGCQLFVFTRPGNFQSKAV